MSVSATPDIEGKLDEQQRKRDEIRGVIAMSVPMVVTLCSRMFMDIADFAMISRMGEGAELAQGAMLPAQITMWTFIVTGMATISIVNTFVSQSLGRGRPKETSAYAWQGVYLALAYGLLGWVVLAPLLPRVFSLIGHSAEVQALELAYARISVYTVGATVAAEALSGFFNGLHRPKVTMWSAIEANLINVVVSWVLIFGHLGFPAMGIEGAAWGTLIGVVYRFFRLLATFLTGDFAWEYDTRLSWRLDLVKVKSILRIGFPNGMQGTSDVFVWMVFVNVLTGRMFGQTALVASNVAWQYLRLTFMPSFGVGIALSALVGKAIGKRDFELAERCTRIALVLLGTYLLFLTVVFFVFREALIYVLNDKAEIVRMGAGIMICAAVFQVFDGVGILYHAALKGAGDTLWPAVLFIVSHWAIVVGGGYCVAVMMPQWGVVGPWTAAATLIIFLCFALWWRWRTRRWQRIDIFRHEAPAPA